MNTEPTYAHFVPIVEVIPMHPISVSVLATDRKADRRTPVGLIALSWPNGNQTFRIVYGRKGLIVADQLDDQAEAERIYHRYLSGEAIPS